MASIKNTRKDWQKLSAQLLQGNDHTIEVTVSTADIETGNVTNLRYFFPLALHQMRKKLINDSDPLILHIKLGAATKIQQEQDCIRIQRFFSQLPYIPAVKIFVDKTELVRVPWDAGRIFPLCQVSKEPKSGSVASYQVLTKCLYDPNQHTNVADPGTGLYPELANDLLERVRSIEQYEGNRKRSLTPEEKTRLQSAVNLYLERHLGDMCVLAQIIWLYILRELQESKQLFSLPESRQEAPYVYENVLAKSRMDAVVYGEGMQQLIENACLHSCGHTAWFGFRMYRAGREVSMSDLVDEVRTRKRLHDTYKPCFTEYPKNGGPRANAENIFNQDHRFYFEFFVLDDAADQLGMVGHYNQEVFKNNRDKAMPFYLKTLPEDKRKVFKKPEHYNDTAPYREAWDKSVEQAAATEELRSYVESLEMLFLLPVREKHLQEHLDDLTVHYGLRLLRRIISVNGGYLMGHSPNGANQTQYYLDGNPSPTTEIQKAEPSYVTEWSAILPITYQWSEPVSNSVVVDGQNCFGRKIERPRKWLYSLRREEIFEGVVQAAKLQAIDTLRGNLHGVLSTLDKETLEDSVVLLQTEDISIYDLEVFSKALFSEISEISRQESGSTALRIALVFSNANIIHEFVRLFSIFYLKQKQPDMEDVQIALCGKNHLYGGIYDVEFMLAGASLSSAYGNARLFAYHHSENTLEHLPLLEYITAGEPKAETTAGLEGDALFPFELCLPPAFPTEKKQSLNWKNNWFIQRIRHILHTDIRGNAYGCMIDDIHIRLSSKLHLDRFYEAELLFHNMGNVARFAYMIAQELIYGKQKLTVDQQVLLLGYEKYSAPLMLQIEYWIRQSGQFSQVYTASIYDGEEEGHVEFRPYFDLDADLYTGGKGVQAVSILPVGTTLSTIYKMHNTANRNLRERFGGLWSNRTLIRNICLILVNGDLNGSGDLSPITQRYWSNVVRDKQIVIVNRERDDAEDAQVSYLIGADVEWKDPKDCDICKRTGESIRPIIDTKQSNTLPGAIFSLHAAHAGSFLTLVGEKRLQQNQERIRALFGNISYSHIYDGNNHFQFYLHFQRIYMENQEDINQDLRKCRVEQDGFHVVVSPLQLTNSTFVKAVVDYAFSGNARFLHVDLNNSYREEIRTKFSYLSEEFRRMRQANPKAKFRVHFVDTSIVTGTRLNRARLLIQMLLHQSGIAYEDVRLFDRVLLLVNRCSYASASHFVRAPEDNLYAYIHLAIPSYNTESDFCPACALAAKYQLLKKRSSTERLSGEFLRLQDKHKKRKSEEYERWLDGSLLQNQAQFSLFKQWLYVSAPHDAKRLLSFVPDETREREARLGRTAAEEEYQAASRVRKGIEDYAQNSGKWDSSAIVWGQSTDEEQMNARQKYLGRLNEANVEKVARWLEVKDPSSTFRADALKLMRRHLISVRYYMRLVALQRSYEVLDRISTRQGPVRDGEYRATMLNLIGNALVTSLNKKASEGMGAYLAYLDPSEQARFLLAYNAEWLISFIKVLSRFQLANYYDYRQAITGIMSDMLRLLSRADLYSEYLKDLNEKEGKEKKKDRKDKDAALKNWGKIVRFLGRIRNYAGTGAEPQLCTQLCYQINMTLIHRMADLQINSHVDADSVVSIMELYRVLVDQYFSAPSANPYIGLPVSEEIMIRYLKSVKAATMTSNDDGPCLLLADTPDELEQRLSLGTATAPAYIRMNIALCARYIYMENTRMLYSGMRNMEQLVSADVLEKVDLYRPADSFSIYMGLLSAEVDRCLRSCYHNLDKDAKEEDIFYQNMLGNFCRFWHQSTGEAPVGTDGSINCLAYMLQYFRRLIRMSSEEGEMLDIDELPYLYEELCRTICGFTGFQMCYIAYRSAGNLPEVFTQSGYHVELMADGLLLTAERLDEVIRHAFFLGEDENILIPGVAKLTLEDSCDYLAIHIPLAGDSGGDNGFYLVLQAKTKQAIFGPDDSARNLIALRKARDILFMRRRLQEALTRDYTVLINFRFDCSYVRTVRQGGHPSVIHISDLHIQENMLGKADDICRRLQNALEKCGRKDGTLNPDGPAKIDLLVISGDIVDSRDANAPRMEQNYHHAEQLLNRIVSTLWKDASGYLPHDWRRRIIITTGNHDYASMNQYQAALKQRMLAPATPAEGESGTMSKFAYYIDFLIRYLDPPVDELLRNDLNEVRYYRKLNLKVLTLNCSGMATPRRTNKMGINKEKVDALLQREIWTDIGAEDGKGIFRLVVGHYSPQYNLSYFIDDYPVLPGWVWGRKEFGPDARAINYLVDVFVAAVSAELQSEYGAKRGISEAREAFRTEYEKLKNAMEVLDGHGSSSPDPITDAYCEWLSRTIGDKAASMSSADKKTATDKVIQEIKENELYRRIVQYYEWIKDGNQRWSEEISRLFFEVSESVKMSISDKESFHKLIEDINKECPIDLYLAGHIHAYAENTGEDKGKDKDEDKDKSKDGHMLILVADKLFDSHRDEIHGYIIRDLKRDDDGPSCISERFQ